MFLLAKLRLGRDMLADTISWFGIAFLAFLSALLILMGLHPNVNWRKNDEASSDKTPSAGIVFLVRDEALVDATSDALSFVGTNHAGLSDYTAVLRTLAQYFPDLEKAAYETSQSSIRIFSQTDPAIYLEHKKDDNQTRLELNAHAGVDAATIIERWRKDLQDSEKSALQAVVTQSPQLIWRTDTAGEILWANEAYAKFVATHCPDNPPFPSAIDHNKERFEVKSLQDDSVFWFEVTTRQKQSGSIHFADRINDLVKIEKHRDSLVNSLVSTFAGLPIGLAVFDSERRLVSFNPAFREMTDLPVDFLLPKPTIDMFLDRLREKSLLPAPIDQTSWREQFAAIEAAAKEGNYCKNWTLPDGQTFRVTGRPQPEGAFAFLFEDITAELSLTRRFRTDIETTQAVLDKLPDAIAVFSAAGTLVNSNRAYAKLWSTNHELMLEHRELRTELATWQDRCIPSPVWNEMRKFIQQQGTRKQWSDDAMMDDGRQIRCMANPITGGMTMVRFVIAPPMRPLVQKLTGRDQAIRAAKR